MLNIFNQSCRGPRWGVAKTRIVHTAAAIVCGLDIEETVRCVLIMIGAKCENESEDVGVVEASALDHGRLWVLDMDALFSPMH